MRLTAKTDRAERIAGQLGHQSFHWRKRQADAFQQGAGASCQHRQPAYGQRAGAALTGASGIYQRELRPLWLNLRRYAHFTSPIRRYADLIVHRALITALNLGDDGLKPGMESKLAGIGEQISMTERRAMMAERETSDRLLAYFLADQIGARFNGRIAGVIGAGLFVRLDKTGADGFIPASTLGTDYFVHDESQQALIGERTGERFRIGDQVEVRLMEAVPLAGSLRFEMLSKGEMTKPIGRGRPKRSFGKKSKGFARKRGNRSAK